MANEYRFVTVALSSLIPLLREILVFVQPDMKDSDIFLLGELGPEHQGQVLRDPIGKIRHVQVLVINSSGHEAADQRVDHHPVRSTSPETVTSAGSYGRGPAAVAAPEDRSTARIPACDTGGGSKLNPFGEEHRSHFHLQH